MEPTKIILSVFAEHFPLVNLLTAKNQAVDVSMNSVTTWRALARDIMQTITNFTGIIKQMQT